MTMIDFGMSTTKEMREEPIEILELSPRSENALGRAKIKTIGEIIENWDRLYKIRNLGDKSVREIKSKMFEYNLENLMKGEWKEFISNLKVYEVDEKEVKGA